MGPSTPKTPGGFPGPPGLPGQNPLSPTANIDLAGLTDPGAWPVWWAFNQHRFLRLQQRVNNLHALTGSDDFYLGDGTRMRGERSGGLDEVAIEEKLTPALLEAIRQGGDIDLVNSLLVALAKIGDPGEEFETKRHEFVLTFFLPNKTPVLSETAAISLGILASEGSVSTLEEILADSPEGRKTLDRREISARTRSFAAYALGLIALRSENQDFRRRVVRALVAALEKEEAAEVASLDLQVASIISLGLVRLDRDEDCECDGIDHKPDTSRQALMYYLTKFFCEPRKHADVVRAHCANSIARQMRNLDADSYKAPAARALMQALKSSSREHVSVRRSCILALGLMGDADDDPIDAEIRATLMRMTGHAEEQCSRFALMALGEVGGRPGDDESDPLGAAPEVRKFLLRRLAKSPRGTRSWAALALGVMGHDLAAAGETPSEDVSRALRSKLQRARSAEDFGALALACGLRGDAEAVGPILKKMKRMREPEARGHAALALGLIGEGEAVEPLQELLRGSVDEPAVHRQAAIGLALLGDSTLADELLAGLLAEDDGSRKRRKKPSQKDREKARQAKETYATALSYVGNARVLDQMLEVLADTSYPARTRGYLAMALGQMADRELLPWNAPLAADTNYMDCTESLTNAEGTGVIDRR